ncbi:hypothetical protein E3N88_10247 [Mikania micrantha]|uniref:Major facilitator superfamily (MFS) profile domain-containing protein n=1 Tax=Mikania micrantha TaxID=192012 RepID=A0A5N6PCY1_9ASTR|nr:hypothetical protein E3N88_10247 [Mikania micrantha]
MPARPHVSVSMYKRMSSKDGANSIDLEDDSDPSSRHSLPNVLVASIVSFLFGYHLGVVNEPLESISYDLGFNGNSLAEGLSSYVLCLWSSVLLVGTKESGER